MLYRNKSSIYKNIYDLSGDEKLNQLNVLLNIENLKLTNKDLIAFNIYTSESESLLNKLEPALERLKFVESKIKSLNIALEKKKQLKYLNLSH